MTVSTAVAEREANPKPTPKAVIKATIDTYRPVIASLLEGTGISEATFVSNIANALRATPKLWQCNPETVLGATLKCAQLGLAPNDHRNLAWIVPYGNVATFQLGYGGVMELARRASPGITFDGRPVYPGDEFSLDHGRTPPLEHREAATLGRPRGGDAFYWYVRARFPDGREQVQGLDREGVEHHRSFSKQPNGEMWTKSYDMAALKSCVIDLRRWLPSSPQMAAALALDGSTIDVREIAEDDLPEPIEATHSAEETKP
jgi:recombination protein RecT